MVNPDSYNMMRSWWRRTVLVNVIMSNKSPLVGACPAPPSPAQRAATSSVPCRTSTTSSHALCSLPGLFPYRETNQPTSNPTRCPSSVSIPYCACTTKLILITKKYYMGVVEGYAFILNPESGSLPAPPPHFIHHSSKPSSLRSNLHLLLCFSFCFRVPGPVTKSTLEPLTASFSQTCFSVACSSVRLAGWSAAAAPSGLSSSWRASSQNFLARA